MKNFIQLDENKWPKTKGMSIDGMRFYTIDGKNYPSITTVLGVQKKEGLERWRKSVGEEAAKWEMNSGKWEAGSEKWKTGRAM